MPTRSLRVLASTFILAIALVACDSEPGSGGDAGQADGAAADGAKADAGATDVLRLEGVLIDDFEDGDGQTTYGTAGWYSYDDKENGGGSAIAYTGSTDGSAVMSGPGFESARSLEVTYTFDQGALSYPPFVGWGAALGTPELPLDVSQFVGIGYTYRGSAHRVRVETYEVANYDYFGMEVGTSANWKTVVVPFARLTQAGWDATAKVTFNPQNVGNVSFEARGSTGVAGQVNLDNLMFLTRLPDQPPDMEVKAPAPPADEPIPSIVITHPAQARAMAYLNKGYNITNWLEEERFAGFTYDAEYVTKLAAAGFKALRLPVDLDLYVVSTTGTGDAMDVVVHDDLYAILDAFILWTGNVGMSLTIDYHQYDASCDLSDPVYVEAVAEIWGRVAEHFAAAGRRDLFFELLNEVEQSTGLGSVAADDLTAFATRLLAAIREFDPTRVVLFGDVQWYGIFPLVSREPFDDENVIYVFHFYEPFIFTHQGTSWTDLEPVHDVPYPYSPERWFERFADLGFDPDAMPSWVIDRARSYYRQGNRDALYNEIARAKRWAVDHGVPVICNEFGAYDGGTSTADRAAYYADLIGVFEELEIPWTHWFMVMDRDTGAIDPAIAAAMGLTTQ